MADAIRRQAAADSLLQFFIFKFKLLAVLQIKQKQRVFGWKALIYAPGMHDRRLWISIGYSRIGLMDATLLDGRPSIGSLAKDTL